jgi:hypothetical protein
MGILLYVIILLAALIAIVAALRPQLFPLRRIGAYAAIPQLAGEAVEMGKAVHVSLGSSAIRETSTLSALAGAEILYHIAERAALSDKPTVVTLSDPITLALGQDTLRRAYKARDALNKYRSTLARWYPQGPQSLAFAAGAGTTMLDEDASTNVLVGRFGEELMLIAENAIRYDRQVVAHSDQIDGQAIAYVVSDAPLIGEEMYAGGGYLGRTPLLIGSVVAQDALRYIVITIIIGLALLAVAGTTF